MSRCVCGGALWRHASVKPAKGGLPEGARYRCATCGKSLTVRDGKPTTLRGRPRVPDWRVGA
jgi:transposase-like protein